MKICQNHTLANAWFLRTPPLTTNEIYASAEGASEKFRDNKRALSYGTVLRMSQGRLHFENLPESRSRGRMFLRAPSHTTKEIYASAEGASEKNWDILGNMVTDIVPFRLYGLKKFTRQAAF